MPTNTYQRTFDELDEAKYIGANAARHSGHAAIEFAKYAYLIFLFYHTHQIRSVTHYHAKNWVSFIAIANLLPLTLSHVSEKSYQLYRNSERHHEWGLHLSASLTNSIALVAYRYLSKWGMLGHIAANVFIIASAMSFSKVGYQPLHTEENVSSADQVSSIARYKQRHGAFKCNLSVLNLLSTVWPLAIDYCAHHAGHNYKMKVATYSLLASAMCFYAINVFSGIKLQGDVSKFSKLLEEQDQEGYEGTRVVADQPNSLRARLLPPFSHSAVVAGQAAQQELLDREYDEAEQGKRRVSLG
ncbi:MAG: hypothetical protein P1U34_04715 [Coxiellaceae bacterium]|nr:hypothetical protein [Coxiellaceae bacterium]